jgi:hypothetical protein
VDRALRVLLFQKKLELMVPALVIDEFDCNRPRREDALTQIGRRSPAAIPA